MKETLTRLFWPILRHFEGGDAPYEYRPMHRKILFIVGFLMLLLATISFYFSLVIGEFAGVIAVLAFVAVGGTSLVIGFLGSDRAVARIWSRH
jgi:hypothetical protein